MSSEFRPLIQVPDHELLRCIGKGSYGEVWLARSLMGTYRAVKAVWRASSDDGRLHDREFDGLKRYEQVSRRHEGLVDVLHIGRSHRGDYFYYVMELADDVSTQAQLPLETDPSSYRPRTLRQVLKDGGRMSLQQALDIAARLASGLAHLHNAGLVHRDIKPSNVIFVHDQPKLADVGLVTTMSDQCSFVGTEGFVAPEGPGTVEADIYSLGKLLYEMATGLDRMDFPRLPAAAATTDAVEEFAELNEVLLRACDKDPARRYRSAEELRRELLLLQGGRSVRKLRLLEKRAGIARKISLATATVAVVVTIAYYGSFRQFQRAQEAERKAQATVEMLQLQQSDEHFRRDDSSSALAILAHLIRENPRNRFAVERLLDALTWRNFALPKIEPLATDGRPRMALFSKDDSEILTGTYDGNIELWDTATGRRKNKNQLSDGRIYGMDFSPDGTLAAIGAHGYGVVINSSTLQPVIPLVLHSTSRVVSVQFSPDQRWFLSTGQESTARLWNVATGEQVGESWQHESSVRIARFSPDGKFAATGTRQGRVRIWDIASGKLATPVMLHTAIVWQVTFSPDGRLLATASDDHEARIWDAKTGTLRAILRHNHCVADVNFSPDGTKVVTASEDLTAAIWDVATGNRIGKPLRHRNWVKMAAFSPDGLRVVTASEDNTTRIWDAETTEPIVEPMRHSSEVPHAAFSHSGNALVSTVSSASVGAEVWLWDVASQGARGLPLLSGAKATDALFSPDGSKIAVACADGTIRIWPRKAFEGPWQELNAAHPVQQLAFSEDGRLLAAISDSEARVWNLESMQPIGATIEHKGTINSIEFNRTGTQILTSSADGNAALWDVMSGQRMMDYPSESPARGKRVSEVFRASFSPDNSMVVTACRNERAIVWQTQSGLKLAEFPHEHWVGHAEFSPDGRSVLTSSIDRSAIIWDIATARPLTPPLTHDSDIKTAHFSGDGRKVVTTSMDWTARVWDAKTGRPISGLLRHEGPAKVASFSPTSRYLITGADDGVVRLRDSVTGIAVNDGFRHGSPIEFACFSPDGELVLVLPRDGDVTIYELNTPVLPAPSWLPDLAEAVAGQRLDPDGTLQTTSPRRFFELRRQMTQRNLRGFYARWAAWFLQDSTKRTISPRSKVSMAELTRRQMAMNTVKDLRRALQIAPTNAVAHGQLAKLLSQNEGAPSTRDWSLAEWHISHALELQPDDETLRAIHSNIASNRLSRGQTQLPQQRQIAPTDPARINSQNFVR